MPRIPFDVSVPPSRELTPGTSTAACVNSEKPYRMGVTGIAKLYVCMGPVTTQTFSKSSVARAPQPGAPTANRSGMPRSARPMISMPPRAVAGMLPTPRFQMFGTAPCTGRFATPRTSGMTSGSTVNNWGAEAVANAIEPGSLEAPGAVTPMTWAVPKSLVALESMLTNTMMISPVPLLNWNCSVLGFVTSGVAWPSTLSHVMLSVLPTAGSSAYTLPEPGSEEL